MMAVHELVVELTQLHAAALRILPRLRVTIIAAFLAVTSSASFAQLPSQWNDAVRALAEKIAAAAASAHSLALNTTNTSSLSAADVSGISSALIAELARRHFTILSPASPSPGDAQVLLTLSEGAEGYVWVAQIRRGTENGEQVAIVAAPGPADSFPGAARKSLALSQKLIWRQPEKFLDFALLPADPSSSIRLVILDPEKLAFYAPGESQWQLQHVVRIPHSAPWPRDVTGEIDASAGKASLPGVELRGRFRASGDIAMCPGSPREGFHHRCGSGAARNRWARRRFCRSRKGLRFLRADPAGHRDGRLDCARRASRL